MIMISPIRPKIYSYNNRQVTFKAHPDFDELKEKYEIKASSYFRRGGVYGAPSDKFEDIIRVFKDVFGTNSYRPKKMLIAGIGDSQEPFSYLATIKHIIDDQKLDDTLDLRIVDLQSKPSEPDLFKQSFFDHSWVPDFVSSSFIIDNKYYGKNIFHKYRVKNEIFDFLNKTYRDCGKAHWESRVQEDIKNYQSCSFDVISMNNVIPYIVDNAQIEETLKNIHRILKPNGVFITDPYKYSYFEESDVRRNFTEIADGIYKKSNKVTTTYV